MTLEDEIRRVRQFRAMYESAQAQADEAKEAYDRAHQALFDRMEATGVKSINLDGATATRKSTVFGNVNDKAEFIRWAELNAPELVSPAPRKALVNELVRQKLDNGEELPPGVDYFVRNYVSQTPN